MSDDVKVKYVQGTPEAERLNALVEPILYYLKDMPQEAQGMIFINLGVSAYLQANWKSGDIKKFCTETVDVQVTQLAINKAGAN